MSTKDKAKRKKHPLDRVETFDVRCQMCGVGPYPVARDRMVEWLYAHILTTRKHHVDDERLRVTLSLE